MNTSPFTYAYSQAVVHITDKTLQSLLKIIVWSGLDTQKMMAEWAGLSYAIKTWITSGHFKAAILEVYNQQNNKLINRWDISIDYGLDDDEMWLDIDSIKYAIRKNGLYPSNCRYDILVSTKPGRPDLPGWSSTYFRSTDGLERFSIGSTAGAGSLGISTSHYR